MEISDQNVHEIERFAENRQIAERETAREPLSDTALHAYTRRLDATLKSLQEQVKRQEKDLTKLRELNSIELPEPGTDTWARVSQARRAKRAYESVLKSDHELPATDSVLPALLALQETARLIKDNKTSVQLTAEQLSTDRDRLRVEDANLRDSQAIASGLRERIQIIRNAHARKTDQTPSQVAREQVAQQKKQNKELDRTSARLKDDLDKFIDDTLAPMLAAEDLGGPTVGDELEVSDATLNAGYTAHGKPKKQKQPAEEEKGSQQRIDRFLQRSGDDTSRNKREAAAKEIHQLLDDLLEANASYVNLKRDSASSRFLVRAKVAQFHPRDARRLRLIDFGRSLGN